MDSIEGHYHRIVEKFVKQESSGNDDLLTLDHHVIKAEMCLSIDKLTSKELSSILVLKNNKE